MCFSSATVSIFGMRFHGLRRSLPFPPKKNGKPPKEENAAPSLRPENFAGHSPPESSLPAVAQTSAPADATGEIFSLRAPASVQRGGGAAPVLVCVVHPSGCTSRMRTYDFMQERPHIRWLPLLHRRCERRRVAYHYRSFRSGPT